MGFLSAYYRAKTMIAFQAEFASPQSINYPQLVINLNLSSLACLADEGSYSHSKKDRYRQWVK
jgi:hypothetical protein